MEPIGMQNVSLVNPSLNWKTVNMAPHAFCLETTSRRNDDLSLHTGLQACLRPDVAANGRTRAGKTWFKIYNPSGLGLCIFAATAPMEREGTLMKNLDSTSMEKTSMANLLPLNWSISGMISLNT
jgi:hypothetical protein